MKGVLTWVRNASWFSLGVACAAILLFGVVAVQAASTISTNIATDGNLSVTGTASVTGQTTLGNASSTVLSNTGTAYFGGTATTTVNSAGNVSVAGTLGVTGASTLSSTLAVTGATTLSASTTVGTATLFAGDDMNRVGVGTTTPLDLFHVENQTATTSIVVSTGAANLGGRIILEDSDGAGCSEISALNGTLTAATITCPSGI